MTEWTVTNVSPIGDGDIPGYRIEATNNPSAGGQSAGDRLVKAFDGDGPEPEGPLLVVEIEAFAMLDYSYGAQKLTVTTNGEVTNAALRTIPVSGLVRHAMVWLEERGLIGVPDVQVPDSVKVAWTRGRKDEAGPVIAKVYRNAIARNLPPTETVAKQFDVSRSTAARMVRYARENGYLTV